MTQRQLAERIVNQAVKCEYSICCLCKNYQTNHDDWEDEHCFKYNNANPDFKISVCIEGVRDWLIDWRMQNAN